MKPTPYPVSPWFDLRERIGDGKVLGMGAGPDGKMYLIVGTRLLRQWPMGHGAAPPGFGTPNAPDDHRLVITDGETYQQIALPEPQWHYYGIAPLPEGDFLINDAVYSPAGKLKRTLEFGYGIEDIQTTSNGVIWTSYFDEGVFSYDPVSQTGLNAWDKTGDRLYAYAPVEGTDYIADCYALNVASDKETWFYYYTAFQIVKLVDFQIAQFWDCPIKGCHNFAVSDDYVLMQAGYNTKKSILHLVRLHDSAVVANYQMQDEQGRPLEVTFLTTARGGFLYCIEGTACYRVDIDDLIAKL
jgi:hypothetical protein